MAYSYLPLYERMQDKYLKDMDELFSQVDEKRKVSMNHFSHVIVIVSSQIPSLLSSQHASGIYLI